MNGGIMFYMWAEALKRRAGVSTLAPWDERSSGWSAVVEAGASARVPE